MTSNVTLPTSRLNKIEFIQLITSSLDSLEKKGDVYSDNTTEALLSRIKKNLPQLKASLIQQRGSQFTKDIREAQTNRNNHFTGLTLMIMGQRYLPQKEKQDAYKQLSQLFKNYTKMKIGNMEQGLALGNDLILKLVEEPYSQAITELNLSEFVDYFKTAQTKLYQLYLKRSQDNSSQKPSQYSDSRETVETDYRKLYNYLQAKLIVDDQDECLSMVTLLNDIRREHAINLKHKKSKTSYEHRTNPDTPHSPTQ